MKCVWYLSGASTVVALTSTVVALMDDQLFHHEGNTVTTVRSPKRKLAHGPKGVTIKNFSAGLADRGRLLKKPRGALYKISGA